MLKQAIRKKAVLQNKVTEPGVSSPVKEHDIKRIETFSDAVFAFSFSLLIMSLEVPQTFTELKHIIVSFIPFVATVSLVILFWYQQNKFFRNYNLNDFRVIVLNAALLVLVLFYIYPLKFLFSLLTSMVLPGEYFPKAHATGSTIILPADMPLLVMIYSIGYAAIWLIFYLLYRHAWKKKETLYLTAQQQLEIQRQLRGAFLNISIGVTALVFAALGFTVISGLCFILILPAQLYNDRYHRKQLKTHIITAQKS